MGFYDKHGSNMYIHKSCSLILSTGQEAVEVYVLPKFKLHFALEKASDMRCAQKLAVAVSGQDVKKACGDKVHGTYCFMRHQYCKSWAIVANFKFRNTRFVSLHF